MARKVTRHTGHATTRHQTRSNPKTRSNNKNTHHRKSTGYSNGRSGQSRSGTRAMYNQPKKNNQNVVIGSIVGVGAVLLLVIIIAMSGGKDNPVPSDTPDSPTPANVENSDIGVPDYTIKDNNSNPQQPDSVEDDGDDDFDFGEKDPNVNTDAFKNRPKR